MLLLKHTYAVRNAHLYCSWFTVRTAGVDKVVLAGTEAWIIVAIFALMFTGITVAALWFAHSTSKIESRKELQKRKIDVVDKHFNEMLRLECPYCNTIYRANESECPNCSAQTKKILFPEMPD